MKRRYGQVFIAENSFAPPRFVGHWEDADRGVLVEDGPGWEDVEEAIAWGRGRAHIVTVRLLGTGPGQIRHYSAGLHRPQDDPDVFDWPPKPEDLGIVRCSYCSRSVASVGRLVQTTAGTRICAECVEEIRDLFSEGAVEERL